MTWRELLRWGQGALRGEDAAWEAWLLFAEAFQTDRAHFLFQEKQTAAGAEQEAYQTMIRRRQKGEPVAYILGSWEFMGLPFQVSPAVLIPRPDTETLVEAALEWAAPLKKQNLKILDLCTGSGCIAVSLAHELPGSIVEASDLSEAALAVARSNAERNGVSVSFWQGDLWEPLPAGRQYDLITANPPYIDRRQLKELAPDVREFEPAMALDGGEDGLDFYRRLADRIGEFLQGGGRAYWEIGYDQGESVADLANREGLRVLEVRKDLAGHDRVVIMEKEKTNV